MSVRQNPISFPSIIPRSLRILESTNYEGLQLLYQEFVIPYKCNLYFIIYSNSTNYVIKLCFTTYKRTLSRFCFIKTHFSF